ncbi:hypothetical protein KR100_15565 [Synechococcus sp. KORDI-100]|nr:hypothetical protein KR100_15565 [Synechococcus sp. KORDI-100]
MPLAVALLTDCTVGAVVSAMERVNDAEPDSLPLESFVM